MNSQNVTIGETQSGQYGLFTNGVLLAPLKRGIRLKEIHDVVQRLGMVLIYRHK